MTATVTPLAAIAQQAWAYLLADNNPMAAVDYVRETSGVEDTQQCKAALYAAAADEVLAIRPKGPHLTPNSQTADALQICDWEAAGRRIDVTRQLRGSIASWASWCDYAKQALALCREIERMP